MTYEPFALGLGVMMAPAEQQTWVPGFRVEHNVEFSVAQTPWGSLVCKYYGACCCTGSVGF